MIESCHAQINFCIYPLNYQEVSIMLDLERHLIKGTTLVSSDYLNRDILSENIMDIS